MSFTDRPLVALPRLTTLSNDTGDLTLPPLTSWSNSYHTQGPFSSPPRSSSPPSTPNTTRHTHDYPHIYSSPHLDPALYCRTTTDIYEDPNFSWHRLPVPRVHQKTQSHDAPVPRSAFKYQQCYRLPSEFDSSDSSEHMDMLFGEVRSALPTRTPHRPVTPLSDSQDEEQENDPGFSFSELGIRPMYFRTSAERGRWKTDPQRPLLLSNRNSVPANEAANNVVVSSRPISEPAPSTRKSVPSSPPAEIDKRCENLPSVPEVNSAPSPVTLPSIPTSPALESMDPLPPLTSDRDSSTDADEILTPLSPLPPSSPPPFSPAVSLAPLRARSTSLSNYNPSSPIIAPSSPLSPISSEIGEEDALDLTLTEQTTVARETEEGSHQEGASTTSDLDSTPTPRDHSTCLLPEPSIIKPDPAQSTTQLIPSTEEPLPLRTSRTPERVVEESHSHPCVQSTTAEEHLCGKSSEHSPEPPVETEASFPHQDSPIKDIVPSSDIAENAVPSSKRPKLDQDPTLEDGPARKRIKTADNATQIADVSPLAMEPSNAKSRPAVKKRRKNPVTPALSTLQKRRPKYVVDDSDSDSSASSLSSSSSSSSTSRPPAVAPTPPRRLTFSDGIERDQNGIASEDAEICGMIIEGMATSRASSLPITQVCKIVMQSRPSMKAERSENEWCDVFDRILRSGTTGRGSGVFGKVDSSYKDEHKAAEARWFYVPEMDCDQERAALIRSMMPRPGKRNVTKKYKQYYYQPLDKISRWDPEDDL